MIPGKASRPHPIQLNPFDIRECLDLDWIFPSKQPTELELGSGDGAFILHAAEKNPHHNFIATERLLGRLRKIDRLASRANLHNLRAVRHEISYLIRYLIPESSIHRIHVYFPDPWPKKRHARLRLIRPPFTRWVARVLEPGGCLFTRTDDLAYAEQIRLVFAGDPEFHPIPTPLALSEFKTEFENQWNKMGIPTNYAAFQWFPLPNPKR